MFAFLQIIQNSLFYPFFQKNLKNRATEVSGKSPSPLWKPQRCPVNLRRFCGNHRGIPRICVASVETTEVSGKSPVPLWLHFRTFWLKSALFSLFSAFSKFQRTCFTLLYTFFLTSEIHPLPYVHQSVYSICHF